MNPAFAAMLPEMATHEHSSVLVAGLFLFYGNLQVSDNNFI